MTFRKFHGNLNTERAKAGLEPIGSLAAARRLIEHLDADGGDLTSLGKTTGRGFQKHSGLRA